MPILYFIKQGTIRDFGIETLTSQEVIDKIVAVDQIPIVPAQQPLPVATPAQAPIQTVPEVAPTTSVPASQPSTIDTTHISTPSASSITVNSADNLKKAEQNNENKAKKEE